MTASFSLDGIFPVTSCGGAEAPEIDEARREDHRHHDQGDGEDACCRGDRLESVSGARCTSPSAGADVWRRQEQRDLELAKEMIKAKMAPAVTPGAISRSGEYSLKAVQGPAPRLRAASSRMRSKPTSARRDGPITNGQVTSTWPIPPACPAALRAQAEIGPVT